MKKLLILFLFAATSAMAKAQTAAPASKQSTSVEINNKVVDIACGECQFKMKGKSCDLAVKIDGVSYFVDGKSIDDFGDAHAKHGFCNAVSKAEVTGEIVNNRFKAKSIKLLPAKKKA